jgi:hypothetical protein
VVETSPVSFSQSNSITYVDYTAGRLGVCVSLLHAHASTSFCSNAQHDQGYWHLRQGRTNFPQSIEAISKFYRPDWGEWGTANIRRHRTKFSHHDDRRPRFVHHCTNSQKIHRAEHSTAGLSNLRHACPKWHAAFTAVPIFCPTSVSILWTASVYTHISDTVQTVYEPPLLPNNTAVKHFYTNRSGAKCWLDIYRWGAGLVVTGRIRDIGQNVLQSSLQREVAAATVTATFSSLSHFSRGSLWEIQCNNYTMI